MAEIKSTLDLIMEKTKHLSLNDREKKAFERQQLVQRVRVHLLRFLNGEKDAGYLAQELDHLPPEKRDEGKKLSLDLLMERTSPFEDDTRILEGVARLLGENERERWEKALAPLKRECQEDLQKAREASTARSRASLAAAGLRGSALLPPFDDQDPWWKEELQNRIRAFRERTSALLHDPQR